MYLKQIPPTLFIACFLLIAGCKSTEVATDSAPEVAMSMEDQLVEKNITALGGLDNIRALETVMLTGSVAVMGMDLPLTVYQKRPGMMRTEVMVPQMGMEFLNGYDGETAWAINPMQGTAPQTMTGAQAQMTADQADLDGMLINYKEKGTTLEYLGEEDVRGTNTHKLKVTRPDRADMFIYLDAETYLEVKTEGEGIDPQSGATVQTTTYLSDYREVNGVLFAFAIDVESSGATQKLRFESVKVNTVVDDAIFALPSN